LKGLRRRPEARGFCSARACALQHAAAAPGRYLESACRYGLAERPEQEQAAEEDGDEGGGARAAAGPAASQRAAKIARFRAERYARARLEQLAAQARPAAQLPGVPPRCRQAERAG